MAYPFLQDVVRALTGWQIWLPLPTFGLMLAAGALSGFAVFHKIVKEYEADGRLPTRPVAMSANISDFATVLMIGGLIGARVFSILEDPTDFFSDPIGILFSSGGLAIYGGIICGFTSGYVYVRRKKLPARVIADASAAGLMISYAVGRIGCQISGDGDWGIPADLSLKPAWLPEWFWVQSYTHNVVGRVIPPPGVYPTPLYESAAAFLLFAILYLMRNHRFGAGWLFALYLFLAGAERFFIEKIRVNVKYSVGSWHFTQAELISVIFMALGLAGMGFYMRHRSEQKSPA